MEQMKKQIRRALGALLLCAMTLPCAGAVNWGLWYGNGANQPPSGEDSVQTLSQYGAYSVSYTHLTLPTTERV